MDFQAPQPWSELTTKLTEVMDATYKIKKDAEPKRRYLGASAIGDECARKVAYGFHGVPEDGDGFSGRTYRIFDMGHDGEDRMADYLRVAGFDLHTHKADGGQFGFSVMDGKLKGHIDGVMLSGPIVLPYPIGWENKAVGPKKWNEFVKKGVKKVSATYYGQVQILSAYLDLPGFLFTAQNRETCEIHAEFVELDTRVAQDLSDRAVAIVRSQSPEELPRVAASPDDFRCKWCNHASTCWAKRDIAPAAPIATPAWLTNGS